MSIYKLGVRLCAADWVLAIVLQRLFMEEFSNMYVLNISAKPVHGLWAFLGEHFSIEDIEFNFFMRQPLSKRILGRIL